MNVKMLCHYISDANMEKNLHVRMVGNDQTDEVVESLFTLTLKDKELFGMFEEGREYVITVEAVPTADKTEVGLEK